MENLVEEIPKINVKNIRFPAFPGSMGMDDYKKMPEEQKKKEFNEDEIKFYDFCMAREKQEH